MCTMSDDGHETETARPSGIRTACHACHGQGIVWVPTFAIVSGMVGTKTVPRKCPAPGCDDGWLDGLRPPA